jgi:hypothetical protein
MNFIEIIYFSQYYELKKTGKDPMKGRLNGTLLSATVIILNLVSLILILFKVAPHSGIVHSISHLFSGYEGSGRGLGKLIALALLVVIGGLLWNTTGSEASYKRIAEKYLQLSEEAQQKTVKQSLYIFLFSFAFFLLLIFTTL